MKDCTKDQYLSFFNCLKQFVPYLFYFAFCLLLSVQLFYLWQVYSDLSISFWVRVSISWMFRKLSISCRLYTLLSYNHPIIPCLPFSSLNLVLILPLPLLMLVQWVICPCCWSVYLHVCQHRWSSRKKEKQQCLFHNCSFYISIIFTPNLIVYPIWIWFKLMYSSKWKLR